MEFGKIITEGFDEESNFARVERNIVEGMVNSPISCTIEERVKVRNIEDEVREYRKFSEAVHADPNIIKPVFKIDTSHVGNRRGYYFVIKSYTKLERFDNL